MEVLLALSAARRHDAHAMMIRHATENDLPAMSRLAASLVRLHHAFDADRFLLPERIEEGYRWWFSKELQNPGAVLLVAEEGSEIAGYAYGRMEERDWNMLLDACGALHDLFVDERYRGSGIGRQLVLRAIDELKGRGAPRVVLHAATSNTNAQQLFKSVGFRPTMVEMTCECGPSRRAKREE